ncbi:MAG: hypothetical protein C4340_05735 [Armatimonadota bacterium]
MTRWSTRRAKSNTYSTYGYTVLAAIIEKVTGKQYPQAMRQLVFQPAGMVVTDVEDQRRVVPNRAAGYEASPRRWLPQQPPGRPGLQVGRRRTRFNGHRPVQFCQCATRTSTSVE